MLLYLRIIQLPNIDKNAFYRYHRRKFLSDPLAMAAFENLTGIKIPENIKQKKRSKKN